MRISESFRIRGDLSIVVRRASDQRIIGRQLIRNTTTFDGLLGVLRLMKQDDNDPTDFQVASIRAGTGSTPPTRDDPGLESAVFTIPLTSSTRQLSVPTTELVLSATLGVGDAVGSTVSEAGWFWANGEMGGRQVHAPILLTGLITVSYNWRIGATT